MTLSERPCATEVTCHAILKTQSEDRIRMIVGTLLKPMGDKTGISERVSSQSLSLGGVDPRTSDTSRSVRSMIADKPAAGNSISDVHD